MIAEQQDTLSRAHKAVPAHEPLPSPKAALVGVAATVWVLRRWGRQDDVVTLHSTEDSALADLAEYVGLSWSNVAHQNDVPDQPPGDTRKAVQLYYGPARDSRPDEGYSLFEQEVTAHAETRIVQLDSTVHPPLDTDACHRCGGIAFLARAAEWVSTPPALCVDCHEALGTQQARDGHQCLDGCPQPASHTGLCRP
ncbi:hypothetical protein [Streptomyces griseiscabiei]|uniref:Uncharacterized protein n=1 Tax=Streptomyces griseiscabiei TaxID=2993540 RepID=A0ABU4KXS6_9ACTN|nr:hypothetical protein [Streptomyces griseiscabiei]MBZ3904478.1 hypothetical protein [Streptomyces griseiscabiei]MDX2908227.1 hypothetical protein [Streptomyces griseiscabiei]